MAIRVPFKSLLIRSVDILRWVFRCGIALLILIQISELSSIRPDADRAVGFLIVGGGGLYALWRAIRALERSMPSRRREVARQALAKDPSLARRQSRRDVIAFLLGPDLKKIRLHMWSRRLPRGLDILLKEMFSLSSPERSCHRAMCRCLGLLDMGRGHWARGKFHEVVGLQGRRIELRLGDEEVLHYLLAVLMLLSALFRFRLLKWGLPPAPFTRENLTRLRRSWIPFCLLKPTPYLFPPPLPAEMENALKEVGTTEADIETCRSSISWLLRGQSPALDDLICSLLASGTEGRLAG